ncbi:hypothetical protein [Hyalangium gracile]|uniref:hypothetical protein n=1 Tax=Hyalangium gracile TaxID=394092 RepID=UPI001CCCE2BA|nr:hypothetical protein [Hyalangium gracile]
MQPTHKGLLAPRVMQALSEGLAHADGGEVVVRAGEEIGHIYLHKGSIAWVNCSRARSRARDTLLANSAITAEDLDAALQESQRTRQHLAETLLTWGLIEQKQLWQCLRLHNAHHLSALTELQHELQAIFVPLARTYSAGVGFTLAELLEPHEVPAELASVLLEEPAPVVPLASPRCCALEHAEADHASVGKRLAALLPPGALAGALLDMDARHVCGQRSLMPALEPELGSITGWLMEVLSARAEPSGALPREVLLVAEDTVHVLSRCEAHPSVYLWMMFDGATNVGSVLARCHLTLRSLVEELFVAPAKRSERGEGGQP